MSYMIGLQLQLIKWHRPQMAEYAGARQPASRQKWWRNPKSSPKNIFGTITRVSCGSVYKYSRYGNAAYISEIQVHCGDSFRRYRMLIAKTDSSETHFDMEKMIRE